MRWLCAIDLHAGARAVAAEALRWIKPGDALDLLFVDDTPAPAGYVHDPIVSTALQAEHARLVQHHAERLETLARELSTPERPVGALHAVGDAAARIVEHGALHDAILLATHGRRGLARFWLGSVAEKVIRMSTVPVLVLRLPEPEAA